MSGNMSERDLDYELEEVQTKFGNILDTKTKNSFKNNMGKKHQKSKAFKKDKYLD